MNIQDLALAVGAFDSVLRDYNIDAATRVELQGKFGQRLVEAEIAAAELTLQKPRADVIAFRH